MRQRQPDRANLLPAWRKAVDDSPRDDEMRARVVMSERQTRRGVVDGRGRAREETYRGNKKRKAAVQPRRGSLGAGAALRYGDARSRQGS